MQLFKKLGFKKEKNVDYLVKGRKKKSKTKLLLIIVLILVGLGVIFSNSNVSQTSEVEFIRKNNFKTNSPITPVKPLQQQLLSDKPSNQDAFSPDEVNNKKEKPLLELDLFVPR